MHLALLPASKNVESMLSFIKETVSSSGPVVSGTSIASASIAGKSGEESFITISPVILKPKNFKLTLESKVAN